jgi:DNA-binding MarR family transcriptional regulator
LLTRLKTLKLVEQHRDAQDRRVVWTHISESGLALLQEMDPVILQAPGELLGHLDSAELAELIRLLELARMPSEGLQTTVSCDGSKGAGQEVCAASEDI